MPPDKAPASVLIPPPAPASTTACRAGDRAARHRLFLIRSRKRRNCRSDIPSISPASTIDSCLPPSGLTHPRNFGILRSCSHVARFIRPLLAGQKTGQLVCYLTRTTHVLMTVGIVELAGRHGRGYKATRSCRSVAQSGRAPRSGRGGRRFKSCHSDHDLANLRISAANGFANALVDEAGTAAFALTMPATSNALAHHRSRSSRRAHGHPKELAYNVRRGHRSYGRIGNGRRPRKSAKSKSPMIRRKAQP